MNDLIAFEPIHQNFRLMDPMRTGLMLAEHIRRAAEEWRSFMTDLDNTKTGRTNAWVNVIGGAVTIVLLTVVRAYWGTGPVWSDPDRVGRLSGTVLLILAGVMVVMGCRGLIRSKRT
jgi:hypothetical protein